MNWWTILETVVFNGDAAASDGRRWKSRARARYRADAEVRTFTRHIKAGGAEIPVVVVVVRRKRNACKGAKQTPRDNGYACPVCGKSAGITDHLGVRTVRPHPETA